MLWLFLALLFMLSAWRPVMAVTLLAALLPSYLLRYEFFGLPTTFLELATYAAALGFVFKILIDRSFRSQAALRLEFFKTGEPRFLAALVFFLLAAVMGTIFTWHLRTSAGALKGWFFDPALFGAMLLASLNNKYDFYKIITALSVSVSVISGYGLVEFFGFNDIYSSIGARLDSIFTSPNYHALLAGPVTVLALSLLIFARSLWQKPIYWSLLLGSVLLNLAALYYTYSFGGYLGLSLGLIFVLAGVLRSKIFSRKFVLAALAVFVVAAGAVFLQSVTSPKFKRDFFDRQNISSWRGRLEVWQTGLAIVKRHPVLGVGLGNYDKGYQKYVSSSLGRPPLEPKMIHAHNLFLDFWTDLGIVGLAAFLFLLFHFFSLFKKVKETDLALSFGAAASLVTVLGHGLVDTPYFKNDLSYLFWLIIFIVLHLAYVRKHAPKN